MRKITHMKDWKLKLFIPAVVIGVLYSALSIFLPALSGEMINSILASGENDFSLIYAYILLSAVNIGMAMGDQYVNIIYIAVQKKEFRKKIFEAYLLKGISPSDIPSVSSLINNDVPVISKQYFAGTIDIIKCVCMILFSATVLFFANAVMACIIIIISILILCVPKLFKKTGKLARGEYSEAISRYNTVTQMFLKGNSVVRMYNFFKKTRIRAEAENEEILRKEGTINRYQTFIFGITSFLEITKTVFVLILGIILVNAHTITIGTLITVIQLAEMLGAPMEYLAALLHSKNEVQDLVKKYKRATYVEENKRESCNLSFDPNLGVEVRDLTYQIADKVIFDHISYTFKAGKKYLLSGESGCGKTTLLRLIAGLGDDSYQGSILIDGVDVRTIPRETLYKKVCLAFQEPFLFYISLKENIVLDRAIGQDKYMDIISRLGLEGLLDRESQGEWTPEEVENLSGGEKQRIALARTFAGRPEILLLDEPTSFLDPDHTKKVEELISNEEATIIHICHKVLPSSLKNYDVQLSLINGKLYKKERSIRT